MIGRHRVSYNPFTLKIRMWGEHLAFSETFTAVVARLVSLFGLSMVDCWVNVYRHLEQNCGMREGLCIES